MGIPPDIGHPEDEQEDAPIEKKKRWILALGAMALATLGKVGDVSPSGALKAPLSYVTRCAAVEIGSVDGFVSNQSLDSYQLRGEVRFVFTSGGASSRPDLLVQSNVQLPSGKSVRVARARLEIPLREGEACRLDVEPEAVRRERP
jgi:hypothetical protein